MTCLRSREHYFGRLKTKTTTTTTMKRPKKERTHSVPATREWQLHYETQETQRKQEESQKKDMVEERKWKSKKAEKFDKHKEKGRKQKNKQAFPLVIKKREKETRRWSWRGRKVDRIWDQFVRNMECMHRCLQGSNDSPNVCIIQEAVSKGMPSHVTVTAKAHSRLMNLKYA